MSRFKPWMSFSPCVMFPNDTLESQGLTNLLLGLCGARTLLIYQQGDFACTSTLHLCAKNMCARLDSTRDGDPLLGLGLVQDRINKCFSARPVVCMLSSPSSSHSRSCEVNKCARWFTCHCCIFPARPWLSKVLRRAVMSEKKMRLPCLNIHCPAVHFVCYHPSGKFPFILFWKEPIEQ